MKAVIFDLDGTLIDSVPDLHGASEKMLKDEGKAPLDLDRVRSFVGNGIPNLVERISETCELPLDAETQKRLVQAFLRHYDTALTARTQFYPGVKACLNRLIALDLKLGLCTNKPEAQTRTILKELGLEDKFTCVIGGDSLPQRKPSAEPLLATIKGIGDAMGETLTIEQCLYVGDSEVDAATADAAMIHFAIYEDGYRKTPLESLRHQFAFTHFDVLADYVSQMIENDS